MVNRALIGVTVVVATTGLAGCSHQSATPAASSSTGNVGTSTAYPPEAAPPQTSRAAKWIDLKPGDCLAEPPPSDPAVVMVTVVDCSAPHLAEAYLRVAIPVDAALSGTANAQCNAGLAQYAGLPGADSGYAITYLIDSDQDRTSNNPYPSTVICLLQSAQGKSLIGSAKH